MKKLEKIALGGGCFWCLDPIYRNLDGVENVIVGFAGGDIVSPKYRHVITGETGHAEVLQIEFDAEKISLEKIFKIFFTVHNPTTLNQQGADKGTQYRSIILYNDISQMVLANKIITDLDDSGAYENPIVTQVIPVEDFYSAENYHQDYFSKNPEQSYCQLVIAPKIEKFNTVFKN